MAIPEAARKNFETLMDAIQNDDVCLMECTRTSDGSTVNMICAVAWHDGAFIMTPFAELVDGDPYEKYSPPSVEEGKAPCSSTQHCSTKP